jgi:hypothetical protein
MTNFVAEIVTRIDGKGSMILIPHTTPVCLLLLFFDEFACASMLRMARWKNMAYCYGTASKDTASIKQYFRGGLSHKSE